VKPTDFKKQMHPFKKYLEASLGKPMTGMDIESTQKFLKNDGKVLRFYCTWADDSMLGEKRPWVVHYFLADDTVEVLEVAQPNSGRAPFPQLVKRARLPKDKVNDLDMSRIGAGSETEVRYYTAADFRIGHSINIYGREVYINGCDAFTQDYYIKNYGMKPDDFPRLGMEDEKEAPLEITPPPHLGFGSEEDSLGSFLHLMPKVPKQDFKKIMEMDGVHLRYMATFVNPQGVDKNRKFVLTYYMQTDQISVFEKPERNSGFVGGKFLERSRIKNPSTGLYYAPKDFHVSAEIKINAYTFKITHADDFTMKYMSEHSDEWPEYGTSGTSTARKDAADASLRSTAARAHSVALHEAPAAGRGSFGPGPAKRSGVNGGDLSGAGRTIANAAGSSPRR